MLKGLFLKITGEKIINSLNGLIYKDLATNLGSAMFWAM